MRTSNRLLPEGILNDALAHQQSGRLYDASAIYRQILEFEPENFDALHLLGVVHYQLGAYSDAALLIGRAIRLNGNVAAAYSNLGQVHRACNRPNAAVDCFRKAIAIDPNFLDAANALAAILFLLGRYEESVHSYQRVLGLRPNWSEAHLGLGRALLADGKNDAAIERFRTAWSINPLLLDAAADFVRAIAGSVRGRPPNTFERLFTPSVRGPSISVAFCSIDPEKRDRTKLLYARLLHGFRHEIVCIEDARSLAEAYNRAINRSRGDIIILSHDDIDILAPDFAARLVAYLETNDVVGVIGSTEMTGPSWNWSGHPKLRGWIVHQTDAAETLNVGLVSMEPSAAVAVLDGVFLAARRKVFESVRFDAQTFDGFHLYDIDWSYRASIQGFKMVAVGDLMLVHQSRGQFAKDWQDYAIRFCEKHECSGPPSELRHIIEAELADRDEVRAFFRLVAPTRFDFEAE